MDHFCSFLPPSIKVLLEKYFLISGDVLNPESREFSNQNNLFKMPITFAWLVIEKGGVKGSAAWEKFPNNPIFFSESVPNSKNRIGLLKGVGFIKIPFKLILRG